MTSERLIEGWSGQTAGAVAGRHVLAIQDTSEIGFNTTGQRTRGLGEIGKGRSRGALLHAMLAVDATDGACLGLVGGAIWTRPGRITVAHSRRELADKESKRWLDTARHARTVLEQATSITVIADRESDIYEEFALRPPSVELVIRAQQDRNLAEGGSLDRCLDGWPELGREAVELPAGPGRKARTAVFALRARRVRIKAPSRDGWAVGSAPLPAEVALWLVEAREIDPPKDAEPVHWRLLTTHAAPDLAAARRIIGFYRQRWTIEQLFRVMKTKGFDIEASRVEEGGPFENLAVATLIASIQVLQMVHERDGAGHRPLTDVFDAADQPAMAAICADLEGKTERQKNPHPPNSLAWAAWICARLGGWTGYYGKPGPITIHRGRLQLMHMLYAWRLSRLV